MAGNKNSGRRTDPGILRVESLAREHTEMAIKKLAQLAMSAENEGVAKAACDSLLDRGWGKPAQSITGDDGGPIKHVFGWMPVQS
jgi:hypothetical protein